MTVTANALPSCHCHFTGPRPAGSRLTQALGKGTSDSVTARTAQCGSPGRGFVPVPCLSTLEPLTEQDSAPLHAPVVSSITGPSHSECCVLSTQGQLMKRLARGVWPVAGQGLPSSGYSLPSPTTLGAGNSSPRPRDSVASALNSSLHAAPSASGDGRLPASSASKSRPPSRQGRRWLGPRPGLLQG